MELYGAHGVTGLFAEGGPNLAEDMGALKSWMLSKMAWDVSLAKDWEKVRAVTFSFLCPLLEKYGTFIARCNALI
eukprot:SAG31_NODE_19251_length_608_cov_0.982318_2_plen_74_part_01